MNRTIRLTRKAVAASVVTAVITLAGCATAPIPVNYAPSSIKSATGSLSVSDFNYLPSIVSSDKRVAPNQIRNTALGEVKIDRNVNVFIRDAVFSELRFVGIKTDNTSRVLTGDIEEFIIDDLGYSIDWSLRIKYTVTDVKSGSSIYQCVKTTKRNTAKFANPFGALNEHIKLNVEQVIEDTEFLNSIR